MTGKLYVTATPIGNLNEMSPRAIEVLKSVDLILCEDTAHSKKLTSHFGITTPLKSYHKFTEAKSIPDIIDQLKSGKNIALISDAGMPTISDPGARLVSACHQNDIPVFVVSGPSAVINAAALSGMCEKGFVFIGFLPEKNIDKQRAIETYAYLDLPLIIFSAPHNLKADLKFLHETLGDRKAAVIREMTKMFEEIIFLDLKDYEKVEPKGEYVLVIEGRPKQNPLLKLSIEEHLKYYLDQNIDKKEAIKKVAFERNLPKNQVYQIAIKL
ncbi:MAG TPA: 16S rRNA (cytidine(1402)-2'-O)-methyltransferase [Clostridia bacterium]